MKYFFTLLMIASAFTSYAQSGKCIVKGQVTDASHKEMESATIALLRVADSATVKYSVTDKTGKFQLDGIQANQYMVLVSVVGYEQVYTSKFQIHEEDTLLNLANIVLQPQLSSMNNITVTAKKQFIEQKIDKMVINVDASVTNAGATALEVLEKSPGVSVDKDGNISLKGKQGVTVMMDGRPAYLSGADLVNYLKSLPASAIDQIEIMTNPSAKYDAAGNSGIINIKGKKNKQKGFNGNLMTSYAQGVYWKTSNSLNINYRNNKLNVFANLNQGLWNNFQHYTIHNIYKDQFDDRKESYSDQDLYMREQNRNNSLKLGLDYFINATTTIGVVASGFVNPESVRSNSTNNFIGSNHGLDSIVFANNRYKGAWKNGSINLNFHHQFDSTGKELNGDVDYINYISTGNQQFQNMISDATGNEKFKEHLRSSTPIGINIYSGKFDYSQPLGKEAKLETGVKSSFVKTDNAARYYKVLNTSEQVDYSKTNDFLYQENINAAYVNINKQYKKIGLQIGLRYENTNYRGKQYGNPDPAHKDSSFSKSYSNLFPTVFLSFNANKNNQFGLSIGRRIDRPAYQDLNPFIFFVDKYTYQAGNPFLRPQFTNNLEFSHTFKGFLTTTLNYNHTSDGMIPVFTQGDTTKGFSRYATIVSNGNLGKVDRAGIAVNARFNPFSWWNSMIYANLNYSRFNGEVGGTGLQVEASNVTLNINNQFSFAKVWNAELSGFYRSKGLESQLVIMPMGQISTGIGRQIIKGKGSLKLNVRDIFLTNRTNVDIHYQQTETQTKILRDSRVATITFTLRFGKPLKDARQKRESGGADDEKNRVKVGQG